MKVVPNGDPVRPAADAGSSSESERLRSLVAELETQAVSGWPEAGRFAAQLREIAASFDSLSDPYWSQLVDDPQLFHNTLAREWARSRRTGSSLAMLMIGIDQTDVDRDRELRVGSALRKCLCRPADRLTRQEAGRFLALLPEVDRSGAVSVAERMRQAVMEVQTAEEASEGGRSVHLTVSIGVGTAPWPDDFGVRSLIAGTEEALALAIDLGGDQVVEGA